MLQLRVIYLKAKNYLLAPTVFVLILLLFAGAAHADVAWSDDSIPISVGGSGAQILSFGVHPLGTDCLDAYDDDGPPPVPEQVTKAYFQLDPECGGSIGDRQIRMEEMRSDVQCGETREWELHVEDTGAATQVEIQWLALPIDPLPSCIEHLWLRQWPVAFDGGSGTWVLDTGGDPIGEVDMLAIASYEYTKAGAFSHAGFTITLESGAPPAAPEAGDDFETTNEDTSILVDVLANDSDPNPEDVLTIVSVDTTGTVGCVTNNGNNITFDPCGQFEGLKMDQVDTFTYTISDGNGGTATATVSITVTGVNDVPVVTNDIVGTNEDTAVIVDVLGNDTDVDDALVVGGVTQGANGTVTNNGNNVTYAPNADWCGVDTFTYTADDGTNTPVQGTVTVTVTCVNDVPVAVADADTTDEDTAIVVAVLANDSDADADSPAALGGDVLTIVSVDTTGTVGCVTNNGNNITYDPCGQFEGLKAALVDTFMYTITDGIEMATATVTITVNGVNDPPVVVDDVVVTTQNTAVVIDVLGNDSDPDDALAVNAVTQGANGIVTNNGNNVTYNPNPDWIGEDTFTYTVLDGVNPAVQAAVTVTVTDVPAPPIAVDDEFTVTMNSGLNTLNVLSNDFDPNGDVLSIQSVGPPAPPDEGCPTIINAGDHIKYAPCPDFIGVTTLTYIIEDSTGLTAVGTVTIEVLEENVVLFFDDFETDSGWSSTGQWYLREEGFCCPDPMPSETHAWGFGNNGFFVSNGLLTSPPINVLGYSEVDVALSYCFDISRAYGLRIALEADFGNGWIEVAQDPPDIEGGWMRFGPVTVSVPGGAAAMRLRLNLRSRFGWGCIFIDNVSVMPVGAIQNEDPVAVAGDDQAPIIQSVVHLDGSGSWDPDGDPLTFDWEFFTVPAVALVPELTDPDTATPSFTPTVVGSYVLELTVDDGRGGTDSDTVTIEVQPMGDLLFYDDMESGSGNWNVQGKWALINEPDPGAASESHAWQYGSGLLSGTGTLTSVAIDIFGQAAISVQFSHFLHIESYAGFSPAGTKGVLQVLFNNGADWQTISTWPHDDPDQDAWSTISPLMIDVPVGATLVCVRFLFVSRLCLGGWWIDNVRVMAGGSTSAMGYSAGSVVPEISGDPQVYSMQNNPNPIRDVHTTRFEARGAEIEEIRVQVFDLSGRLVFDSDWQPNGFEWHLDSAEGDTLANGVYVYIAQIRGIDGGIFVCETKKLAVYR